MKKSPAFYLEHIIEAADYILAFCQAGLEGFFNDIKTQAATLRYLEIIGEAARQLGPDFHQQHADLPWVQMISLRNLISHEYFRVRLNRIWEIVSEDMPLLLVSCKQLLIIYLPPA